LAAHLAKQEGGDIARSSARRMTSRTWLDLAINNTKSKDLLEYARGSSSEDEFLDKFIRGVDLTTLRKVRRAFKDSGLPINDNAALGLAGDHPLEILGGPNAFFSKQIDEARVEAGTKIFEEIQRMFEEAGLLNKNDGK
jgi:hypothetical protein